jgi:hypothetical protein
LPPRSFFVVLRALFALFAAMTVRSRPASLLESTRLSSRSRLTPLVFTVLESAHAARGEGWLRVAGMQAQP